MNSLESFEKQDEVERKDLEDRKHQLTEEQRPKATEAVRQHQKSVNPNFDVHSAEH